MKRIKRRSGALRALTALLALCLVLPVSVRAEEEELRRYIVTARSREELSGLRDALEQTGAELVYSYERAIPGFCVLSADPEELSALEGVERVITPQSYRTLSAEGSLIDEADLERDEEAAAGAIDALEGYNGAGTVVAVLDDGFDTGCGWLVTGDVSRCALGKYDIARSLDALCAATAARLYTDEVWRRWKVPFAYDYAQGDVDVSPDGSSSHGTEVASLIGANAIGGGANGAAPGAQLLLMKVASGGVISECELIAALEDALILGADVINLSLGGELTGGHDGSSGLALAVALDNAAAEGVSIICAAGNDGESGGGIWEESYGITQAPAASPDRGTLSPLAALPSVTAAGSVDYYYRAALCMESAEGLLFTYSDSSASYTAATLSFTAALDGKRLEYVPIPGTGAPEDYEGLDVSGKLALISRGELTFAEKLMAAADKGAAGAIIYNNEPDAELVLMQMAGTKIPAVFVSLETGAALAEAEVREIIISDGRVTQLPAGDGGGVSAFSSRGVSSGLVLAPDLCAFGGNLRAPSAETSYEAVDGTSYSAALLSGYTAVLLQYRREAGLDVSPVALRRALMNSAVPLTRADTIVSPRAQGAGLCNIAAAAELTLEASGADGGASFSIGETGDKTELSLTVKNLTNEPRSFTLSASVVTDGAVSRTYDEDSGMLLPSEEAGEFPFFVSGESVRLPEAVITVGDAPENINSYAENAASPSFTVAAGGSLTLTLTLECGELPLDIFTGGCFIEGMLELVPDSGSAVSLPFCGFCGDWSASDIMDASIYGGEPLFGGAYLYTYTSGVYYNGVKQLGTNDYDDRPAKAELAAFSPDRNGSCEYVGLRLSLLRDADMLRYEISDGDGGLIYKSSEFYGLRRSTVAGEVELPVWNGSDPENGAYIYPDGEYILRVYAALNGGEEQLLSFTFILDTGLPEIGELCLEDGELYLEVSDDTGIQMISVYTVSPEGLGRDYAEYFIPESGRESVTKISLDVSGVTGEYIYIEAADYAGNVIAWRTENPQ